MGKGEIARNEQFLLFPQRFLLNQIIVSPFVHIFDVISLFTAKFDEPKIGLSGKGLMYFIHIFQTLYSVQLDRDLCKLNLDERVCTEEAL